MRHRNAYSRKIRSGCMRGFLNHSLTFFTLFLLSPGLVLISQELPEYDEIGISLIIPRVGVTDIDAIIRDEQLYLPVTELFDFLKIKNIPSPGMETITGFFINPEAKYEINRQNNSITYQGRVYNIDPGDLIRTESNLYLHTSYFGKIFGLECIFNFRSLSVTVNSKLELPLIREMRQEEMRRNLTRLKGEVKADTNISRTYPMFKFGMADWSAVVSEEINGQTDTRFNLSVGSMIAKGEFNASLNYNNTDPFSEKQQHYHWRYVNNEFNPLRQIVAGKIATNSISTIFNPVVGIQLTNAPTTFRRAFGSYTLSDKTEPGWIVELYVNNVLVDYVTADASGFFTFQVPLVYGNTIVKLKFYSPWGEERTKEQNITIPYNFLPLKTFEYNIGAGIVEDSLNSRFSRAGFNYGLTSSLTVGGGTEYLSSVTSGQFIPFLNASLRLTGNILISGEYAYGVRTKGTLSYRMPSNLQLDLNYTCYEKDQKAIYFNYREERKATLSFPLKIGKFSTYQRLSYYQVLLPLSDYSTGEWMFSGSIFGVNTNLTTYGLFIKETEPNIYSNLSMAFRLPAGFIIMPQTQYSYTRNKFITAKIRIEKPLFDHGYLNFSFEQNFENSIKLAELGFRYDFSFAQAGTSFRQLNKRTSFVQYARGSLINDRQTKYIHADNRTNVNKGGISIVPYLDLNSNGKRDPGEPKAYGLNLHTNSGRIEKSDKDTIIHILGLEPYTSCFIEFDPNSFDNISWRLGKKTMSVAVDPNILKLVEIPIIVAGEANGSVELEKDGRRTGLGRIIVNFETADGKRVGRVLTEENGFFSYLGLAPGNYIVRIDTAQLRKLNMISDPDSLLFSVHGSIEGDIVYGLNFTVREKPAVSSLVILPTEPEKPVIRKDTTYMIVHEVVEELVTISEDNWAIQLGAFKIRSNAERYRRTLEKMLNMKIIIVIEDDFWKVRIPDIKTREEVDKYLEILRKNKVTEVWVIRRKAKQQQWLLTEKQDTVINITEIYADSSKKSSSLALSLEVGRFKNIDDAIAFKDTLLTSIYKPINIIREDGYFKVRIAGFKSYDEMIKFIPSLKRFGLKDVWIPPVNKSEGKHIEIEPLMETKTDTIQVVKELKPPIKAATETVVAKEPTIALQVGVFHKKAQALRAQRKITSKLNLPVEIVSQWGYYHVIIPGFYTKEETYKYFPELAGIGYPGVSLIENYKRQQ